MKTISVCEAQAANQYHTHYIDAILSSAIAKQINSQDVKLDAWQIPAITFTTSNDTRVSMTLNGMRMATEFFAYDSPRILQLIEQRLQAKQSDVVHDVLVYLWERVLLVRTSKQEARELHAESLAAYLGLEPKRVLKLLQAPLLNAPQIAQRLTAGEAGHIARKINVVGLTENLLARLQPELAISIQNEKNIFVLIEEIVTRLYDH